MPTAERVAAELALLQRMVDAGGDFEILLDETTFEDLVTLQLGAWLDRKGLCHLNSELVRDDGDFVTVFTITDAGIEHLEAELAGQPPRPTSPTLH